MGCIVSRNSAKVAENNHTQDKEENLENLETDGKTYVVFDIKPDSCATSGDYHEPSSTSEKAEQRRPARLAPIPNPPILTTEMIEEKLRRAEEKRERLLAARRLSCQRVKTSPTLIMQGHSITNKFSEPSIQEHRETTPWSLNWSGDEILTDEQLDALLLAEEERELAESVRIQACKYSNVYITRPFVVEPALDQTLLTLSEI
ncbi:hypothetical protein X801_06606, partial [Opisthorchis viverrini]